MADNQPPVAIEAAGPLGRAIVRGGWIFAMGIVVAAAILILEVVLRYGFNSPTLWAHETCIFLCALAFIYGGLYCVSLDRHIRVVTIYGALPEGAKRVMDVLISLISAGAAALFAWAAWLMVQRAAWAPDGAVRLETSGSAWNPPTPALLKIFLLAALTAMAIQFLVLAVNHARGRR